jgi:hypothetical protein
MLAEPLADAGIDIGTQELSTGLEQSGKAGISIAVANAGVDSKRSKSKKAKPRELTPSFISNEVGKLSGLLVIDEADVVASAEERKKLAELIKHLSDSGSSFKVLIVGIGVSACDQRGRIVLPTCCPGNMSSLAPSYSTALLRAARQGSRSEQETEEVLLLPQVHGKVARVRECQGIPLHRRRNGRRVLSPGAMRRVSGH